MKARIKKVVIISAVLLLVGCAYAVFHSKTGIGIPCPFRLLTGLSCPGCGVTRMIVHIFQGDFAAAFRDNAVLFCLTPPLMVFLALRVYSYVRSGTRSGGKASTVFAWSVVCVLLAWSVVRKA